MQGAQLETCSNTFALSVASRSGTACSMRSSSTISRSVVECSCVDAVSPGKRWPTPQESAAYRRKQQEASANVALAIEGYDIPKDVRCTSTILEKRSSLVQCGDAARFHMASSPLQAAAHSDIARISMVQRFPL